LKISENMREATFLSKNEKKWRKVESILDKNSRLRPNESADMFVDLTDDLSYAKTHFPKSITTRYLNSLVGGIFQRISYRRKEKFERIGEFWKYEVPLTVRKHHRVMLFVFVFFLLTVLIGAISTHYDESFPRAVLGDGYVEMTLENIENGDPMGVYKSMESNSMFLAITFNNLKVASYTFISGILFSLGTLYFLFQNGVMLGSFQYFFAQQGLLLDSFLTIWIHGTIEISSIIIAGTAGVVLGNSFLFPGTFTRKQSLIAGAKDSLKILISIVPLITLAGFLEGFVTRHTDAPNLLRGAIIFLSLIFILWYFVYYPIRLSKK
jgi:uncharacterized membrane protein SpoIIM required for sporulation